MLGPWFTDLLLYTTGISVYFVPQSLCMMICWPVCASKPLTNIQLQYSSINYEQWWAYVVRNTFHLLVVDRPVHLEYRCSTHHSILGNNFGSPSSFSHTSSKHSLGWSAFHSADYLSSTWWWGLPYLPSLFGLRKELGNSDYACPKVVCYLWGHCIILHKHSMMHCVASRLPCGLLSDS